MFWYYPRMADPFRITERSGGGVQDLAVKYFSMATHHVTEMVKYGQLGNGEVE